MWILQSPRRKKFKTRSVHTTTEEFKIVALFLRLNLLSTLTVTKTELFE